MKRLSVWLLLTIALHATSAALADRKTEYVEAVTRGEGFMPWQEKGISQDERDFRMFIEQRKDRMLAGRTEVDHPVMLTDDDFERAKRNIDTAEWARDWYQQQKKLADYLCEQPADFVEKMISELTPTNSYGTTCPNCVGVKSQEGVGHDLLKWDYTDPDRLTCTKCGHVYPSEEYPETARLVCPRTGQVFLYYLNDQERSHPEDRSGKYAWRWVGRPMHVSFTGVIRERKVGFAFGAAHTLATVYRFTDDPRYAELAVRILVRLAQCYRNWLYHDYWDSIADCDGMYAAWHDTNLRLEWKRHLCGDAYEKDTEERAGMLQSYWGAGRYHPSTDAITVVADLALAYDLVYGATDDAGQSLWSPETRARVERDLLLEYVLGAEPYVGGPDQATNVNNKAPRIYRAQAAVAKCLGLAALADTALRGYEGVRGQSFLYDGYSTESPGYTNMYLSTLVQVPEELHGFRWPADFAARQGTVDYFATDPRLRLMFRAMIDQLLPDGRYPPLSDTFANSRPSPHLIEMGQKRYPEYYAGALPTLYGQYAPTTYALFHLSPEQISADDGLKLPEICFPVWQTAILRHGQDENASVMTLAFSPWGGHRHGDNLSLFYQDTGHSVLGDHGYVGDMPVNGWILSTFSHNLVIVDDREQRHGGRAPQLIRMVTTPEVSVVEASSRVYDVCREYRRLVALVKGPGNRTFAVDVFRVKGGDRHDYRLFSELASSDEADGSLELAGLSMPLEGPLPVVGASLKREDIFGLRDERACDDPPDAWQAVWKQPDRRFRTWICSPADRVTAANGPGQETYHQAGRRVRYLDVIRQGENIESTFVAVHEPNDSTDQTMPIRQVQRLTVPATAGPDAVALRIESKWGTHFFFSGFAAPAEVDGIRFAGAFGLLCHTPTGQRWLVASEVTTFHQGDFGFAGATPLWSGNIVSQTDSQLTTDTPRPEDWQPTPPGVTDYLLIGGPGQQTGFPVESSDAQTVRTKRFPLPPAKEFRLPNIRMINEKH